MGTGAHLQYGWLIAHLGKFDIKARRLILLAAILPDLDGLTLLAGKQLFYKYHRILTHNVTWVVIFSLILMLFHSKKLLVLGLCLFSGLVHLACDFVASNWDLFPFLPFSNKFYNLANHLPDFVVMWVFQAFGQLAIIGVTIYIYIKHRRTPLELISTNFDKMITNFIILPWKNSCKFCGNRANYRCSSCDATLCGHHRTYAGCFQFLCPNCQ